MLFIIFIVPSFNQCQTQKTKYCLQSSWSCEWRLATQYSLYNIIYLLIVDYKVTCKNYIPFRLWSLSIYKSKQKTVVELTWTFCILVLVYQTTEGFVEA